MPKISESYCKFQGLINETFKHPSFYNFMFSPPTIPCYIQNPPRLFSLKIKNITIPDNNLNYRYHLHNGKLQRSRSCFKSSLSCSMGVSKSLREFFSDFKTPIEQLDSYFKTIPIILTEHSGPLPVSRNKDYIRTQKKKHNIKKINK